MKKIYFVCVSVRLSSMVRVSGQTFGLPPHLPTYQAKKLVGVPRFSVHRQGRAVQCSAAATVFFRLLSLRICSRIPRRWRDENQNRQTFGY